MSKTMAEEIMLHSPIGRDEQGQYCKACNHRYGYAADRALHQRASAHIAAALSAAGFGLVADAKAEALSKVADTIETYAKDGADAEVSPYETAKWLRTRAAAIRAAS